MDDIKARSWIYRICHYLMQERPARKGLERCILQLGRTPDVDVAEYMNGVTTVRVFMEQNGILPREALSVDHGYSPVEYDQIRRRLAATWIEYMKDGRGDIASYIVVWIHSMYAIRNPNLQLLGRQMWRELSRGLSDLGRAHLLESIERGERIMSNIANSRDEFFSSITDDSHKTQDERMERINLTRAMYESYYFVPTGLEPLDSQKYPSAAYKTMGIGR